MSFTKKNLTFAIFCALFFGALTWALIFVPNGPINEYGNHIRFAIRIAEEERVVVPHFLFQILTIIHHSLLGFFQVSSHQITVSGVPITYSWGLAGLIVMIEVYVGIALVLACWLRSRFNLPNERRFDNLAYLVAFGLSISTPLFILALYDNYFYLGYITPSTIYIIPTQILLKLPSLWLFLLTPMLFHDGTTKRSMLFLAFLALSSGLAKPSWLLVMLPALSFIALVHIVIGRYINWWALAVVVLSSITVLAWQFYFKFVDPTSPIYSSKIVITAPFEVWRYYSDFVFIKIILSVVFPLYVTICFWKQAFNDFYVRYAWLLFLVGLVFTGFLGESEPYLYAGNFIWCGQIACFMLFVATAGFFFSKVFIPIEKRQLGAWIGSALFGAHVVFGLVYYLRSFTLPYA